MKKKFSILLILVVAVLTLAVVGYSAWYITRDPQTLDTGTVQAYTVDTHNVTVALCDADGNNNPVNIVFGRPADSDASPSFTSDKWLRYSTVDADVLDTYLKVTSDKDGSFTVAATNYNGGLFGAVVISYKASGAANFTTAAGGTMTLTANTDYIVKVSYSWALGSNPFTYFNNEAKDTPLDADELSAANVILTNDLSSGAKWKDYANQYLSDVNTYKTDNANFIITVSEN